jgi:hypothetical protein
MIAASAASFIMILYRPVEEAIIPGAMLFGMAAGYCLNKRYTGFKSSTGKTGAPKYITLLFRFLLGIAVTSLIFAVFEKIIPQDPYANHYLILYFLRFVITGLWVCAGAPRLFCALRLAERKEE